MSGVLLKDHVTLKHLTATPNGDKKQTISSRAATPNANIMVAIDNAFCPLFETEQAGGEGRIYSEMTQIAVDVPF